MVTYCYRVVAVFAVCVVGLLATMAHAGADADMSSAVQILPSDLVWNDNPKLPPGVQTAVVWGDPNQPGLFVFRAKWPPHLKISPHSHPGREYVTVVSGVWMTATGDVFDEAKLQALPVGGFYMLPPNVKQFSATGDDGAIIEVTAMGPWGVHFDSSHSESK
jgi:quercetin dioxygenase-like cupin family protein